jgi:3-hydroxy acid dehydrogenase / malonic semialdehyde reductase
MEKLTVLITGASSGIGEATAIAFAKKGAKLIITARRMDRLTKLATELTEKYNTEVLPLVMDVKKYQDVKSMIDSLPENFKHIDVLVNNAGLALSTKAIQDGDPDDWDTMIQTNINGLLYVTRSVLPSMLKKGRGHIINIGSIAGHEYYPGGNVYCATKHAVKAITKTLRIDLLGSPIRVTSVDPGAVSTEFSEVRWKDKKKADDFYAQFTALQAADIADAVIYCAHTPPHVNVAEMIIMPTCQASANHLHRNKNANHQDTGVFD